MNSDQFEGKWKELKGQAQQRWGDLTNDDVNRVEGRQEELEGLLQQRYGYEKDRARREVDEWIRGL